MVSLRYSKSFSGQKCHAWTRRPACTPVGELRALIFPYLFEKPSRVYSGLVSAILGVLGKLFCHPLPLDKFGYLCAQRRKHRE